MSKGLALIPLLLCVNLCGKFKCDNSLQIENDRKFPTKICPGCNIQLEATISFMDLIVQGQVKLRQLYKLQQDKLYRQEKQRQQLEEALKSVNPSSSVDTYTIQSDETGEKFLIQSIEFTYGDNLCCYMCLLQFSHKDLFSLQSTSYP